MFTFKRVRFPLVGFIVFALVWVFLALSNINVTSSVLADKSDVCAVPGRDGPISDLSGIVNTYYPGEATVTAGATSITLGTAQGATTPIAAGDLLLVIQMQDAAIDSTDTDAYGDGAAGAPASGATDLNNAGLYEYVVATNDVPLGGGVLNISSGLVNAYTDADATTAQGQRRFQVVRVPQYSSATLGANLTAAPWDGQTGSVLAVDIAGTLTLNGRTADVDGLGFRGGAGRQLSGAAITDDYRTPATEDVNGSKGEGIAGTPRYVYEGGTTPVDTGVEGYPNGSYARGAPGNAGGGGRDGNEASNDQNSGGGGGGNGGAGGQGGFTWNSSLDDGGFGGVFNAPAATRVVLGGGGGAGTTNDGTPGNQGINSSGAPGGGIVMIRAGTVTGNGTINANGANALDVDQDGGGGGGAGGSVVVIAENGGLGGLTINADGGDGGDAWLSSSGSINRHGPGGGGGGGVVYVSDASITTSVVGGANGVSTTSNDDFGATPGQDGLVQTVTPSDISTGISGAACLPELTIAKRTTTPNVTRTPGMTAQYIIDVSNAAGRGTAIGVEISDQLPAGFTYASTTSIDLTGGAVRTATSDPTPGDTTAQWGTFDIPGSGQISITFTVDIANTVPDGTYQNPASAEYTDPTRTTADGTTSEDYDPSSSPNEDVTIGSSQPDVDATKRSNLVVDNNSDGVVNPSDVLQYTIRIVNSGPADALDVVFTDTPDANTTLVAGSVTTSQGTITSGNTGAPPVTVDVGVLPASGGVAEITYRVTINTPFPDNVTEVVNQGVVSGSNFTDVPTDDPDTRSTPDDPTRTPVTSSGSGPPTAVHLTQFTTTMNDQGISVRWATNIELDTRSFYVYRSPDANRANAVRVSPEILAQGSSTSGATYVWLDNSVTSGQTYSYWLQEVELDSSINWYGPATRTFDPEATERLFLPIIIH